MGGRDRSRGPGGWRPKRLLHLRGEHLVSEEGVNKTLCGNEALPAQVHRAFAGL